MRFGGLLQTYTYGFDDEDEDEVDERQLPKEQEKTNTEDNPGPSSNLLFKAIETTSEKINICPEFLSKGLPKHIEDMVPEAFESHLGLAGINVDDKLIAILKYAFDKVKTHDFIALYTKDSEFSDLFKILNWDDSYKHPAIPGLPMTAYRSGEKRNIKFGIMNAVKSLRGLLFLSQTTFEIYKTSPLFINDIIIPPILAGFEILFDHIRRYRKICTEGLAIPLHLKREIISAPCTKIWNLNEEMCKELSKAKMRFRYNPSSSIRGRGGFYHGRSYRGGRYRGARGGFKGYRSQRGGRNRRGNFQSDTQNNSKQQQ